MATEPELEDFDIDLSDGGFPHNESESGMSAYQHPEEENYETRLEAARKLILRKRDFTSPLSADDFFEQFKDITDKSSTKGAGNLLHVLVGGVKHNDILPKNVEPLVRGLVDDAPDLLKDKNKEGQTPILMAIRTCQDQLLNYMISACVEHHDQELAAKRLNEALTMKQEGKTALHVAFMENLDAKTLWMLIQNASDEALGSKDQTGRTPMHYAVNFGKCKSARMSLIDLFIQRDSRARFNKPRSVETFLDICDNQYCSVFQEHQNTRTSTCARYSDRPKAPATTKRDPIDPLRESDKPPIRDPMPHDSSRELKPITETRISGDREVERPGRGSHPLAPSDEHERKRQQMKELERASQGNPDTSAKNDRPSERDNAVRDISRYRSSRTNDPDEVTQSRAVHSSRQPDLRSNTGMKRSNTFRDEVKQGEGVKPATKQRSGNDGEKVIKLINYLKANSDIVLKKLKLHYMRTRNPEMVILFLYGKNMNGKYSHVTRSRVLTYLSRCPNRVRLPRATKPDHMERV
jgi:ankyrin repeat protein